MKRNTLISPRNRNRRPANMQSRDGFIEQCLGHPFIEDSGKLKRGGNVQYPNMTKHHLIADKMCIDFHMFGLLLMNGIGGEVDT